MLLVIGLAVFFGTVGAKIFQRLRIPQIVGYITIGLLVGRSGLGLIDEEALRSLDPFNFFALGIIGFMIGRELHRETFKKYGRQFMVILFAQGVGAFILVGLVVGAVALLLLGDVKTAVVLGLLFGAISSATAPAATVNVMWEYKTRGILPTTTMAIVALDDALAVALYSIAASIAAKLTGQLSGGFAAAIAHVAYELGGAVALGAAAGLMLNFILRRVRDQAVALTFIIGTVGLVVGAGMLVGVETILASMALGAVLANLAPRPSDRAFKIVERFAPPLYVLFFVMVGASLYVQKMPGWMWALVAPFCIARAIGKILGANIGAKLARAAAVVRKYLGLCLFCQGGVAVGLSLMASKRFGEAEEIGMAIIAVVAVTTFIVEIIGPPCVKFAVKKAGEVGLNVTEDDLMQLYRVGDMMDRSVPTFPENTTIDAILHTIAETDAMNYPVVDAAGRLKGIITIQDLKASFAAEELAHWLVAQDVMEPVETTVTEDASLAEAVNRLHEKKLDYLAVVAEKDHDRLVGLLEMRAINRSLSREILRRHRLADAGGA